MSQQVSQHEGAGGGRNEAEMERMGNVWAGCIKSKGVGGSGQQDLIPIPNPSPLPYSPQFCSSKMTGAHLRRPTGAVEACPRLGNKSSLKVPSETDTQPLKQDAVPALLTKLHRGRALIRIGLYTSFYLCDLTSVEMGRPDMTAVETAL